MYDPLKTVPEQLPKPGDAARWDLPGTGGVVVATRHGKVRLPGGTELTPNEARGWAMALASAAAQAHVNAAAQGSA